MAAGRSEIACQQLAIWYRELSGGIRLGDAWLHAAALAVAHPDGGMLRVDCPLAADIAGAIASCRAAYPG